MTSNSVTYKLSELGAFKNGANYPKGSYGQGDKIVNVKDLFRGRFVSEENLDELIPNALKDKSIYKTQDKDLLFTRSSLVKSGAGMVAMINEPSEDILFCGFIIRYRIFSDQAYPLYMLYLLRSPTYRRLFTGGSVQTNISNINQETLGNIEVHLPKISDQQKIAKVLSDLDAKIELNNKINAELEAMAKLIYDYWFVQFDFPDANGKPYKSSGGAMVYNAELKREIPKGWEVKRLEEFASTGSGGTPLKSRSEYYDGGTIPWINSGEVNAPFIVKAEKFITQEGMNNSSAKLFEKGTILMAMYGATAGKVSLMDLEACTNQAICAINPKEFYYSIYLKFGLEGLYEYLVNLSSGSARDNLSQEKIKELKFAIPNEELLQEYHKLVYPKMEMILLNLKQNQHLSSLRDWLLPMLMNGQVRVG